MKLIKKLRRTEGGLVFRINQSMAVCVGGNGTVCRNGTYVLSNAMSRHDGTIAC